MDDLVVGAVMFTEFVDLSMAVVTSGNAIGRTSRLNLIVFQLTVFQPLLFEARLQESAATSATVIV